MNPDELIKQLAARGVRISRRTLQQWTRAGLLPAPATGSLGRGRGRYTDYPPDAPAHALAAWWLLSGRSGLGRLTLQAVAGARRLGIEVDRMFRTDPERAINPRNWPQVPAPRLHVAWLLAYQKALNGWPLDAPARVHYEWHTTGSSLDGTLRHTWAGLRLEPVPPDKEAVGPSFRRIDATG